MAINTIIFDHKFFECDESIPKAKFFLDISGDIISLIGFLIYLEIVILKFCDFDYNTDENISIRGIQEKLSITCTVELIEEEKEEEDEDEDNNKDEDEDKRLD